MRYVPSDIFSQFQAGTIPSVLAGYFISGLACSFVITIGIAGLPPLAALQAFILVICLTMGVTALVAALPAGAFIVWSELQGERRLIAYVGAGIAVAVLVCFLFALYAGHFDRRFSAWFPVAGIAAGAAYWAVSGHRAGSTRIQDMDVI